MKDSYCEFYDSDYPAPDRYVYKENLNCFSEYPPLKDDISFYQNFSKNKKANKILELCCGTGRIVIPLLDKGYSVCAVDNSEKMLDILKENVKKHVEMSIKNLDIICQSTSQLLLEKKYFDLAILAFNSLVVIGNKDDQINTIRSAYDHLKPGGTLLIDILNASKLDTSKGAKLTPFLKRRSIVTGNLYTRYRAISPLDDRQCQTISGFYEEEISNGKNKKYPYEFVWRLIYPDELKGMLSKAGFSKINLYSSYKEDNFNKNSLQIIAEARK